MILVYNKQHDLKVHKQRQQSHQKLVAAELYENYTCASAYKTRCMLLCLPPCPSSFSSNKHLSKRNVELRTVLRVTAAVLEWNFDRG